MIKVEAPAMIIPGILLAAVRDRRWMLLSARAASMVIVHSLAVARAAS